MMRMHDVITVGSATRDVFLRSRALHSHPSKDALTRVEACFPFGAKVDIDELLFATGGGATNNAVTFARLGGLKTAALARIGADSAGRDVVEALRQDHVATGFVQMAKGELTAYSTILLAEVGERTILVYRGASRTIEAAKIPWSHLRARWFCLSSLGGNLALLRTLIDHARRVGAKISMNPGGAEFKRGGAKLRPLFQKLDWLNVNREEAARLTGAPYENIRAVIRALRRFAKTSVITDGPRGAYAVLPDKTLYAQTLGTKPRNVTGAGDAFGSAFAVGLIKKNNPDYALRLGILNADSVIRGMGAKAGILSRIPSAQMLARVKIKNLKV